MDCEKIERKGWTTDTYRYVAVISQLYNNLTHQGYMQAKKKNHYYIIGINWKKKKLAGLCLIQT